ncbi:MAG: GHKL domain-containing protein, partial [Caldithrix sp.]|nr:GHKL domain-containing protein [Caldithrix sp.]
EDLSMITEQAERCRNIVSGLLNFARKNKIVLKATDMRNLIDRCLKAIIKPAEISITVNHNVQDPVAEVDADQIIQVLTNLIMNAIEAMPEGGEINIRTEEANGMIQLAVADNGPGIPENVIQKIFEPLFTTKQIGKGTGLGLAVTYGIIKMHHGQIDVQSNTDASRQQTGTTFIVSLPKKDRSTSTENES